MNNKQFFNLQAAALLMATALLGGPVNAQSAQEGVKPSKTETKAKKTAVKSGTGSKAKFITGSGETPGQRDARLKRECKGAVNAGACTGYTR
ncbi:MAG: hypothetical protein ABI893_18275 [Polaromonas sp.]|uniref:hypothetical protein n=1 Tax=Polaromonas sp. TaxID=1869339 RepID=UPI00326642D7